MNKAEAMKKLDRCDEEITRIEQEIEDAELFDDPYRVENLMIELADVKDGKDSIISRYWDSRTDAKEEELYDFGRRI